MRDALRLAAMLADVVIKPAGHGGQLVTGRVVTTAALVPIAGGLGCAAMGFAIAGIWVYLEPEIGSASASLVVAAILLAGCGVAIGIISYLCRATPRPAAPQVDLKAITDEASQLVRNHKGALLLAAFVAGLLANDQAKR